MLCSPRSGPTGRAVGAAVDGRVSPPTALTIEPHIRERRMAQVVLKDLAKKFDEVVAVRDVNLQIKDKEFVVLVGPSGGGKSTTLRMIAGLEEISSGEI